MAERLGVLVINQISASGLARLPAETYRVGKDVTDPVAILVRSADLHGMAIPASVRAIGRAGAGTNNIPVEAMSERGVPVFNAPGGNANAVKELVLAGMLMAARQIAPALRFVGALGTAMPDLDKAVEQGKKAFAGYELAGRTLGVIGLGKIGCLVADAAIKLGMNVLGFDPEITVDAAWSLPSQVRRAASVDDVLRQAHFVTLHVPLLEATRHLVNDVNIGLMRPGAVLLNFSRDGVVSDAAVLAALAADRLGQYVCDFPSATLLGQARVVALPHLGASTSEAEENCAVMVVDQLRDYLEHGNLRNAVNFPQVGMARESAYRMAIANANVPNMLGQISTAMARAGLNIHNMVNKSRGGMAYTLVDVDSPVLPDVQAGIAGIAGVLAVRYLPAP
ncbi:MAG: 3-phosphoglycerate dehydrogenase family protein [Pseudomonadota bacterium]|nr:3-phosphoglycerate dehydrogenase family protein [Pseudomonadota bacterium]